MSNYNYAIEKHLAERGGEADKDITRTCGNCESYDAEHWQCLCADVEDGDMFRKKTDVGCYYHRTNAEQTRIKELVKKHQEETHRLRLEEQRRNGTGECAGCPFREMHEEMYAMLKKCLTDLACSTFYNRYEEMKELMHKLDKKGQQQ